MNKLPVGTCNVHIQQSMGADTNIMKFYITQNSTTYGACFENFKPRQGYHRGTGYLSNYRPSVIDDPVRSICDENYHSVTQLDFQPYREHCRLDKIPMNVVQASSGFGRRKNAILPVDFQGSQKITSETHEQFQDHKWPGVNVSTKEVGPQSMSVFIRNNAADPITFEPQKAHDNLKPGWCTHRPTGMSISKTSYTPKPLSRGDVCMPGGISHGSVRDTSFSREEVKPKYVNIKAADAYDRLNDMPEMKAECTRKQDPVEYINMQNPHNKTSVQHEQFKGHMHRTPTEAERLHNINVDFQKDSGYVKSSTPYLQLTDEKMRFMTHYTSRFGIDPTPVGAERTGHLRGGIQKMRANGFTKSVGFRDFGSEAPSAQILDKIESYVGRSFNARNVFYDDHTYDAKLHT